MRMWWVESESLISDSVGTMEWYLYLGCFHLGWSEVGPWMKKCECPAGSGGHGTWDGFSDSLYRPPVEKMCSSGNLSYFWTEGWEALTSLPLRPKDEWPYCSLDPPALFFFFFLVEEEPGVEVPRPYSSCPVALWRCSRKRWCEHLDFLRIQASLER